MNSLQGLLYGLSVAATPANLLAAFAGAFAGTAIGVLPGLGPVAGVALILPLTFSLDPTAGLIMMAVITKTELLSLILGGIFAIEAASVITQVISFKLFKKRVFLMAPIHHHLELKGWPEPRVIVRFWIITVILVLIGLATLKLR